METYYNPADLGKFSADGIGAASPELWEKYMGYYGAVFQDGALTAREKSLIAVAVAAAVQCPYCIDAYTNGLLERAATKPKSSRPFTLPTQFAAALPWYMAFRQ